MTITVQMKQLVDAAPALAELGKAKLPTGAAYRVMKLIKAVRSELTDYDEARTDKAKELGIMTPPAADASDDEKQAYQAKVGQFEAEVMDLLENTRPTLTVNPLPFADIEKVEIAPLYLEVLEPFIEAPFE